MEGVVLRGDGAVCTADSRATHPPVKPARPRSTITRAGHYTHNYNASFLGFAPVTNPALVCLVTIHDTSGENGQGADAAAPVFQKIMDGERCACWMCRRIFRKKLRRSRRREKKGEFAGDLAIADLGGKSIHGRRSPERAPALGWAGNRLKPAKDPDEIPPPKPGELLALARSSRACASEAAGSIGSHSARFSRQVDARCGGGSRPQSGIDVMIEGSGIARAQVPLPGSSICAGGTGFASVFTR